MLNTLGVVQVRASLSDASLKVSRKLGGKSLLEWVVRRVTDCLRLDGVVVVSASHDEQEQIAQLAPPDVPVFRGQAKDPLARLVAAIDEREARHVVRVCTDNPFVDPVLIDRLVTTADAHPDCDYISYCSADGRPAILKHLGVLAEWCSASALRRANREARQTRDRENATSFLYAHPEHFNVRLIPLPAELDRDDLRLRVDHEEDWEHMQVICEALGHDEWDWQRVAELLDSQPALRRRMAMLNRATVGV